MNWSIYVSYSKFSPASAFRCKRKLLVKNLLVQEYIHWTVGIYVSVLKFITRFFIWIQENITTRTRDKSDKFNTTCTVQSCLGAKVQFERLHGTLITSCTSFSKAETRIHNVVPWPQLVWQYRVTLKYIYNPFILIQIWPDLFGARTSVKNHS